MKERLGNNTNSSAITSNLFSSHEYSNKRKNTPIIITLVLHIMVAVAISAPIISSTGIALASTATMGNVDSKAITTATMITKTTTIQAGGGSSNSVLTQFIPNRILIKTGDSVIWNNPTTVGEPHTVTFVNDNRSMAELDTPFTITNSATKFIPVPSGSNSEPILVTNIPQLHQVHNFSKPNQVQIRREFQSVTNIIVASNARAYLPTVIDFKGKVKHLPPNSSYIMTGDERYVNSGWIFPQGQSSPGLPKVNSFKITFEKKGVYNYICLVHPWMHGTIVVK